MGNCGHGSTDGGLWSRDKWAEVSRRRGYLLAPGTNQLLVIETAVIEGRSVFDYVTMATVEDVIGVRVER